MTRTEWEARTKTARDSRDAPDEKTGGTPLAYIPPWVRLLLVAPSSVIISFALYASVMVLLGKGGGENGPYRDVPDGAVAALGFTLAAGFIWYIYYSFFLLCGYRLRAGSADTGGDVLEVYNPLTRKTRSMASRDCARIERFNVLGFHDYLPYGLGFRLTGRRGEVIEFSAELPICVEVISRFSPDPSE